MSDAVVVAVIVAVPTTLAPVLLRLTDSKARREEKEQEYARDDEIQRRVAEVSEQARRAAELLLQNQKATRLQVDHLEESATHERDVLSGKLDMIHSFVNSDMTARMRTELALMQEIKGLREEAGSKPSDETVSAIARLEAEIAERDWQQAIADKALADTGKAPPEPPDAS